MREALEQAEKDISVYREDIIAKLLEFARTDLLFFWGEKRDLYLKQQVEWQPILDWAGELLHINLKSTDGLEVPENEVLQNPLEQVLKLMSDKELACYYAAALNMRSNLLALALVKGRIDARTAGKLSYLEELWQNDLWGTDAEAESRREERCKELQEIEDYLKK